MSGFLGKGRVLPSATTALNIYRTKISGVVPAHTDFISTLAIYNVVEFVNKFAIFRNGQLLFNGEAPSEDEDCPIEVYPGSNPYSIRFVFNLLKGDTIQIIKGG